MLIVTPTQRGYKPRERSGRPELLPTCKRCVALEALRVRGGTSDGSAAVRDITGFLMSWQAQRQVMNPVAGRSYGRRRPPNCPVGLPQERAGTPSAIV